MKFGWLICAPLLAAVVPAAVLADDPKDPAMRGSAARQRDREIIRQLNLQQLAHVRERDARYAEGWRAWRGSEDHADAASNYSAQSRAHERDRADYAEERARYDRQVAAWRRAVQACRAGDYSACD
ncbi:MAG: hypothetical protein EOO76_15345 [Novosphingobium sp.]|nr:MAG: hypothetical protein EOO76_15345 [Novosphingobium sp.]